ncbi:MAG: GntR family transcriptional regulator [Gammaproteobacteria bacterium]|nr:GntR family transcriptional regulator [Gammaproteobacteria bacterium]MCY4269869.1 GntR family transcriptional regulator [Gammaproteobacteria bacterium]MCY4297043.1 GntR family transcriptional regulator [Gammaproteobacteria bacterium]
MIDLTSSKASGTPLYLQIAKSIRRQINEGQIATGDALPSERDLCELTGASRVTVRKAVDQLIDEGLLWRRQGSGTYVTERIEVPANYLGGFTDDARARGQAPGSIWLVRNYANPTREEAETLKMSTSSVVARLGRVRLSEGEPLAIEHAVVAKSHLPPIEEIGDSLYAALDTMGNRPRQGRQKVRASLASPTEAGLLSIQENSEVLRIERVTWLDDGTMIEFTRSAYRGDRYEFVTDIK